MKAFLFSDSHEDLENIKIAIRNFDNIKTIFHMGDLMEDTKKLQEQFKDITIYGVTGNNDYYNNFNERVVNWNNYKIFMTHGDKYNVYYDLSKIYYKAKEENCHLAFFGHTHKICFVNEDVVIINPGSISLPRDRENPSFAIIDCENGKLQVDFFEIHNDKIIKL